MKFSTKTMLIGIGLTVSSIGLFAQSIQMPAGCNDNVFLNSVDPNTIGYDNIVSAFHSTMALQKDGSLLIWGEGAGPLGTEANSLDTPTVVSPANGYNYTGNILRYTIGSYGQKSDPNYWTYGPQFIILTTDGLYAWGTYDVVLPTSIKNTTAFEKISTITGANTYGLPIGVNPADVNMMFAAKGYLAITTAPLGEVYVLGTPALQGAGGSTTATSWQKVKTNSTTDLTNIVAIRGTTDVLFALSSTQSGSHLYTWGKRNYLGDGTSFQNLFYATSMNALPNGEIPKMIDMSYGSDRLTSDWATFDYGRINTYHVLSTAGHVYSLGSNMQKQIGDGSSQFTVYEKTSWTQPVSLVSNKNIVWISASGRDATPHYGAAINALSDDGKLYAWGSNASGMINGNFPPAITGIDGDAIDPVEQPGGLSPTDKILAVATGGHTSMVVKECTAKFGYVGHLINGSMGGSSNNNYNGNSYTFLYTGKVDFCGVNTNVPITVDSAIYQSDTAFNLMNTIVSVTPAGYTIKWYSDAALTTEVTNTNNVPSGTYYPVYFDGNTLLCSSDPVVVTRMIDIEGSVFDDANGNTIIDGTELGTNASTSLYVYLVDDNNIIVDSALVAADGTYTLHVKPKQGTPKNYTLHLSQVQYAVGVDVSSSPIDYTLPTNWVTTGENGNNNTGSGDGSPDGILTVSIGTSNVTNANFGIEQIPTADAKSYNIGKGAFSVNPPTGFSSESGYRALPMSSVYLTGYPTGGALTGSDPEDCATASSCNTGKTFSIESINSTTKVYYDFGAGNGGVQQITAPTAISNFDPSKLVIYGSEGQSNFGFTYSLIDAAGVKSPTASYNIITSGALSVKWSNFDATKQKENVLLTWTTLSEANNKGFEVQRSTDARNWKTIGFVTSKANNANSRAALNYNLIDAHPVYGINYYRLKQVDFDGVFSYSEVRNVKFDLTESFRIYPNPAQEELMIEGVSKGQTIVIYNTLGQEMKRIAINQNGLNKINIADLADAHYQLVIINGNTVSQSFKFVKK
ncbi:MAG TPA: T9SS type A sorting domain-containing protein [Edaphocola sp.]|nr:T9SS type A sorting domain-containing protein [Edaphocola sp.]